MVMNPLAKPATTRTVTVPYSPRTVTVPPGKWSLYA
jgi:hypothetical protein